MRAELVILIAVFAVGAAAFALEGLGPDAARIIGIGFCLLLVTLLVAGMVARASRRKAPREDDAGKPDGSAQ